MRLSARSAPRLVELGIEVAGHLPRQPRRGLEILARGRDHRVRRPEMAQKHSLSTRSDAAELLEDPRRHGLVAARAVMLDREAVRRVAHALEELELRGLVLETQRRPAA